MTTILTRKNLENYIITDIFLPLLRDNLKDPSVSNVKHARPSSSWIRCSLPVRQATSSDGVRDYGSKRTIVKESAKAQYPYVILTSFEEENSLQTIDPSSKCHYAVDCTLTIRVLDVGDVTRVANLAGQISHLLQTKKKDSLLIHGLQNLEWNVVSLKGYTVDSSEYYEKQIVLAFTVSL